MNGTINSILIHEVAEQLGIKVISETKARCFNVDNHKNYDSNPSLSFIEGKSFKCYACGIKGNIPELVKIFLKIEYSEAVDWLTENFGAGSFKREKHIHAEIIPKIDIKKRTKILTDFIDFCGAPSDGARHYYRKRNLSDGIIDWFRLTDVKERVIKRLEEEYSNEELESSGIVKKDYFIFNKHELLMPYFYEDSVVFVKGRSQKEYKPKYIGLSSSIPYPYNINILLHPDITREHVFITEGEIDCLTLLDKRLNAIAVPGVNGFKEEWIQYFITYEVVPVIAFDNDEVGIEGAKKLQLLFSKYGIGSKIKHPEKKDWNGEEWTHKNY